MIYISRKGRRERKNFIPILIHACTGVVANYVTTRGRREFSVSDKITKTMTMTMTILTTDNTDWMDFHRFSNINEI